MATLKNVPIDICYLYLFQIKFSQYELTKVFRFLFVLIIYNKFCLGTLINNEDIFLENNITKLHFTYFFQYIKGCL